MHMHVRVCVFTPIHTSFVQLCHILAIPADQRALELAVVNLSTCKFCTDQLNSWPFALISLSALARGYTALLSTTKRGAAQHPCRSSQLPLGCLTEFYGW